MIIRSSLYPAEFMRIVWILIWYYILSISPALEHGRLENGLGQTLEVGHFCVVNDD